jgi:hypothetical protein
MVRRVEQRSDLLDPRPRALMLALAIVTSVGAAGCRSTPDTGAEVVPPDHDPARPGGDAHEAAGSDPAADAGPPAADLSFIHNQLIVKPRAGADGQRPSREALGAAVQAATGATVSEVRPGPAHIVLVVFAPTDPPRDGAALAALQAALEATDAYEYVQPNRLYEAKSGEGGDVEAPSE